MKEEITEMPADYEDGINMEDIQTALVDTLKEKKLTVASAESFTGGLISKRITDVSGASSVFSYGVCTYSNEAKEKVLGVKADTLKTYGAVSRETAAEMAEGIRRLSGADIGISTTGVAGPEPSEGKPVGKVFIGVSYNGTTEVKELMLGRGRGDDREWIRYIGSSHALIMARKAAENCCLKQ